MVRAGLVAGLLGLWALAGVGGAGGEDLAALERRAATGDAEAAFQVGLANAQGRGTALDPVRAVAWFRRAPEGGHAAAQ